MRFRSIVTDVFDGRILSSMECLTCNHVSETRETFQVGGTVRKMLSAVFVQHHENLPVLDTAEKIFGLSNFSWVSYNFLKNRIT